MKFHNQMIKKTYDRTVQILDSMKTDSEYQQVKAFTEDKNTIIQAVINDYLHRSISLNQVDFFSDPDYYEKFMTEIAIELQQSVGMAEQNMILYNLSIILDHTILRLRNYREENRTFMNIGYVGIDIHKQQLFITDIENRCDVEYQLMLDRNLNQIVGNDNRFMYHVRFRFLGKKHVLV